MSPCSPLHHAGACVACDVGCSLVLVHVLWRDGGGGDRNRTAALHPQCQAHVLACSRTFSRTLPPLVQEKPLSKVQYVAGDLDARRLLEQGQWVCFSIFSELKQHNNIWAPAMQQFSELGNQNKCIGTRTKYADICTDARKCSPTGQSHAPPPSPQQVAHEAGQHKATAGNPGHMCSMLPTRCIANIGGPQCAEFAPQHPDKRLYASPADRLSTSPALRILCGAAQAIQLHGMLRATTVMRLPKCAWSCNREAAPYYALYRMFHAAVAMPYYAGAAVATQFCIMLAMVLQLQYTLGAITVMQL